MRNLLISFLIFWLISWPLLATTQDCYRLDDIEVRNECMQFESAQAIGRLMIEVIDKCERKEEYKFHECVAKSMDKLARKIEELD